MDCRFCGTPLRHLFADLGRQPSANRFLTRARLETPEPTYPLRAYVCEACHLVQIGDDHGAEEVFDGDYVYFSSYSGSWIEHARAYVDMAVERFGLGPSSFAVEVASNDGYLLRHVAARGIPCLGIDPAADAARVAATKGVETLVDYFSVDVARRVATERGLADLLVGNNVLAHAPRINDFVGGLAALLAPHGVLTMEFPHLERLIRYCQFDTIYDEHFFYFSFGSARTVFRRHGLEIFDVEELPTHGGSLRIFARHADNPALPVAESVEILARRERYMGMETLEHYLGFQERVEEVRDVFLAFLAAERARGSRVAAFGAAAKGNTFLNFCGVTTADVAFVVDDTPAKQGKFLPGSHVPVVAEDHIREAHPDVILILPWNFKAEIMRRLDYTRDWGCRFVTCIPAIDVV